MADLKGFEQFDFTIGKYSYSCTGWITSWINGWKPNRTGFVWLDQTGPYHMALFKAENLVATFWSINQIPSRLETRKEIKVQYKIERDHSEFWHEVPEEFTWCWIRMRKQIKRFFPTHSREAKKPRNLPWSHGKLKTQKVEWKNLWQSCIILRLSKGLKSRSSWMNYQNITKSFKDIDR